MKTSIKFGNLSGRYFSQGAIDNVLVPLAESVARGIPHAADFEIWYDAERDFSHLKFTAAGKTFDVQFCKVLSYYVDGEEGWVGCPAYLAHEFVTNMRHRAWGDPNTVPALLE